MMRETHRVILLFGPTAVGKTALLDELPSDRFELINADSMQVYRGMDIGTAKPSLEFRCRIPHHLIDICDPHDQFHVGDFVRLAETAIAEIVSRGRISVVSGGTAYYLRTLMFGMPAVPPSDPTTRKRILEELAAQGLAALYKRLSQIDRTTAERVGPSDPYRIARALEVYESSGKPLSTFPPPIAPRDDMQFTALGLDRPRAELHQRISDRVDGMLRAGLVGEVTRLVANGYTAKDPGMKGIGYREFFSPDGRFIPDRPETVAEQIKTDSRRYAKRQMTFFRSLPNTQWFDPDDPSPIKAAILGRG